MAAGAGSSGDVNPVVGQGGGIAVGLGSSSFSSSVGKPRLEIASRIEALVLKVVRAVAGGRDPAFALGLGSHAGGPGALVGATSVAGARELAGLLVVLRTLYEAALNGSTLTRREVYYMSAHYFREADECYSSLARAGALLEVSREALGVIAAPRGRVAGLLSVAGEDLAASGRAAALPSDAALAAPVIASRGARFLLIVEKEAIFARLVEGAVWRHAPCALITGAGVPDFATRAFAHAAAAALAVPVYALVDSNPYGLAILACYAGGSANDGRRWALPALRWLGLTKADIAHYALPDRVAQAVSAADVRKAQAMLREGGLQGCGGALAAAMRSELEAFCAEDAQKMELEGLLSRGLDFIAAAYLPDKLRRQDWVCDADAAAVQVPVTSTSTTRHRRTTTTE